MFTGFTEDTERFFLDLRFHNNAEFMHANQERYLKAVRDPLYAMVEDLSPLARSIDPLMEIRPHRCISRINRDVRFSKDKSPYRDCMWFLLRRAAEPRYGSLSFCFYVAIHEIGWGLCVNGDNRPLMDLMRRRMEADPRWFKAMLDQCELPERGFFLSGDTWKRMDVPFNIPRVLHPWYKTREIQLYKTGVPYEWAFDKKLVQRVSDDFRALGPLYHMLRGMADELPELQEQL